MKTTHSRRCTHPANFDLDFGDRVRSDWREAINLAARRAAKTGIRHTVRRHYGPVFADGVWYIQKVRTPPGEGQSC